MVINEVINKNLEMHQLTKPILLISTAIILIIGFFLLIIYGIAPTNLKKKIYYIGIDTTWYPLDLRGKEKNMEGFAGDLLQKISENQGFRLRFITVGPNALFDGLNIGSYRGVLSSLTPNFIHKKRYKFSDPFYLVGPVLLTHIDSNVSSYEEMKGKIIGIERKSLNVFEIEKPVEVVLIPYETASEALENLDNNAIDGVIIDALRAHVWADGFYNERLRVATSPLNNQGLRLITLKGPESIKLIFMLNEGLKQIKEDGTYDKLIDKWDLIRTETILQLN